MKNKFYPWLVPLVAALVLGAVVTPGFKVPGYPNTNSFGNSDLLLLTVTNGQSTNYNIKMSDFRSGVTNGLATTSYVSSITNGLATTNYVNTATNGFVGTSVTNGLATTNFVNTATNSLVLGTNQLLRTNGTTLGSAGTVNWTTGVTGSISGTVATLGINAAAGAASLTGTTNFVNFSVQAARLPATGYPVNSGANQPWEVFYYHTNDANVVTNLSATWQFVVPPDYTTNTAKIRLLSTLLSTNGPNSSNVIWQVSFIRSASDDGVNLYTAGFGQLVYGTNTWAQSSTLINAEKTIVISCGTNSALMAGDIAILRIARDATNDTYRGSGSSLVGLQLEYTRQ